jgi:pSer/pThr/pTyr-binding forkhead associated (FHA) protein
MAKVLTTFRLGRGTECDITLPDATVSRNHASLQVNGDGTVLISDLGSANGTFVRVNDEWKKVDRATIREDEKVRFGSLTVVPLKLLREFDPVILVGKAGGKARPGERKVSGAVEIRDVSPREIHDRPRRNPETGDIEEQT